MNAALKYQKPVDTYETVEVSPASGNPHWMKVLSMVLVAALFMTVVAVASVWLRLTIDQKFQKIDAVKIRNTELKNEINKLDAKVSALKSLEHVQSDLNKAGVQMDVPRAVFFIDSSRGDGYLALSDDKAKGSI